MSATRGRDAGPHRRMTSRPASSRRRTSSEYCAPRSTSRCCAGDGIVFCITRILFCARRSEHTMTWDFETEPEFQEKLDWVDGFVREEVEPLDLVWRGLEFTPLDATRRKVVDPLKEEVRRQKLWATHLGPELG